MPGGKERSPNSILAEQMYHNGKKLVDIAKELDVPYGTVRRWKSTQKWDGEKSKRKRGRPKKRGAPYGNHNARGNKSCLPGNQKAVKHGAYRSVFFNFLSPEDRELLDSMDEIDTEDRLLMELRVLTIRERRVLKAIEEHKVKEMYVSAIEDKKDERHFSEGEEGESERKFYKEVKRTLAMSGADLPGEAGSKTVRQEASIDLIARLDRELTSIQRQITSDLKQLEEIRQARATEEHQKKKMQLELELLDARIEQADAQTNRILGTDLELEDHTDVDELLYGGGDGDEGNSQDAPMQTAEEGTETPEDT